MLGLRARLMVVVEMVRRDGHLCVLVVCQEERCEYLPRGPEGAGSEGALSLP
jgi:hypothetical protein